MTKYDQGSLAFQEISEELIGQHLSLAGFGDPDLLIRTGGDARISNFLLWQIAYTELYFTDDFWPDFGAAQLAKAVDEFAIRSRRFGRRV